MWSYCVFPQLMACSNSCINLLLVPICLEQEQLQGHPLGRCRSFLWCWSKVGAYAEMRVRFWEESRGSLRMWGVHWRVMASDCMLQLSFVFMAKQTPCVLGSLPVFLFQNKVYPRDSSFWIFLPLQTLFQIGVTLQHCSLPWQSRLSFIRVSLIPSNPSVYIFHEAILRGIVFLPFFFFDCI